MPISGAGRGGRIIPPTTNNLNETPGTNTTKADISSSLPSLNGDGFEAHRSSGSVELSPAVLEKSEAAVNSFGDKLRKILHHDAMSLAAGHTPVGSGDPISEEQQTQLLDASKDLFMGMPIGSLSPAATQELKGFLDSQGVSSENLENKTLGDLGSVGGKLAKKWANDFKDSSPAAYYGILGVAGAAVGAYGYLEGSDALKKLGIKPEVKTKLFNDQVTVKAEAMWDARFRNANVTADIQGNVDLSKSSALSLRFGSHLDARNLDNTTGSATVRWGNDKNHIDAGLKANSTGVDSYHINGRTSFDDVTLHGRANFDGDFDFTGGQVGGKIKFGGNGSSHLNLDFNGEGQASLLTGGVTYNRDKFNLTGSVRSDLINHDTTAELSAGYRPTEDLEFGLKGGYNSETGGNVGVGMTWRF